MHARLLAFPLLLASATVLAAPRITFVRRVPAEHDLAPAERVAVIYAIGDNDKVLTFVERFVDDVARSSTLRIVNAVENNHHFAAAIDAKALKMLRHDHPAEAYLGVNLFTCSGTERTAEGSERDVDGARVKKTHHWIDATCTARVDVYGADGRKLFAYRVRGEGTSPRAEWLSADEKDVAYEQAARYAANVAAEEIVPRTVKESIELDDSAPAFDEGMAMIEAGKLRDARAIWEEALRRHRDSAALSFDLGALSEASGDLDAARGYFQAAVKLSPKQPRYKSELQMFQKRVKR
ncbi:MAG TPA: tetratricopeptide repeat protein [Thermoanaerobaculia bacterium]|nr:tetratricopeptide repeat protein [Thermoanaerobaculia bacterium]